LKTRFIFIVTILFIFLFGCAKENPDLVNPPPASKTVKIRFLNLAGDQKNRKLVVGGLNESNLTGYETLSDTVQPTMEDSVSFAIRGDGVEEYKLKYKFRIIRDTKYTVIGLPGINNNKPVDTLIVVGTTSGLTKNTSGAYIQLVNTVPDSNYSYSLTLGCPNGNLIAQGISYRMISYQNRIRAGKVPVSLIRFDRVNTSIIGLYELNIEEGGEYAIIVRKNANSEELLIIDQHNLSSNAISPLQQIADRESKIRVLNFSGSAISAVKLPGDVIEQNIQPGYIGSYKSVSACGSSASDSIVIYEGNNPKSSVTASLEVLDSNTVMVFDSASSGVNLSIIAQPVKLNTALNGRSLIRVAHADYMRKGLIVSLGARDDSNSTGYLTGDILASPIKYGELSDFVILTAGRAPITIFSSAQPTTLIKTAIGYFEPNKKYLVVIINDINGKEQVALIDETDENKPITYLEEGVLSQFVNAIPGVNKMTLNIPNVLKNASVDYSTSIATVLPIGNTQVNMNGKSYDYNTNTDSRGMLIASGEESSIDFIDAGSPLPPSLSNVYSRRFVNASKEVPLISVRVDSDSGNTIADAVKYGDFTSYIQENNDRKLSFFIIDYKINKSISKISDILLTFGKNYTIIFMGHSQKGGYSLLIQQEY
jgi:hypothetical protein